MSVSADSCGDSGERRWDASALRRMRWRCRRGMRELDQLLASRLDALASCPDEAALARFDRLLACEDDQLWRWCLGHQTPDDPVLASEVDAIRTRDPA